MISFADLLLPLGPSSVRNLLLTLLIALIEIILTIFDTCRQNAEVVSQRKNRSGHLIKTTISIQERTAITRRKNGVSEYANLYDIAEQNLLKIGKKKVLIAKPVTMSGIRIL